MPGYDVKTVEPLKAALICPECNLLLRNAVQTGDGIRLCETCFKQFEGYPNRTSPKSKMTIGKEYYPDKAVQREIFQLRVLCLHYMYGCLWQGQLQDFEGHCQNCVYNLVTCPNPKLIPAEELKGDIHFDEPFKMVARNHCRKKAVANRLEDLNCCPKVPLDYGESIARDVLKEHQLREFPYVECPTPGCGEILLKETEKESVTTASHFMNPLVLFQHMITLCTAYIGNGFQKMGQMRCKANSDEVEGSETMVSQASYTHSDVPASVDPMAKVKINGNKVGDSKAIVPGVTPTLQEFRSTFISAVDPSYFKEKISTTIAETLNPLVSHLCRQPFAKVEFGRMKYEPVDDPSDRVECPEAFIPSNLFHHMKQPHHLGRYADFFDYRKEGELRRDIEKLLRLLQNCERTGSVRSQWEQVLTSLDGIITVLTRIEAGLLRNNETRLAGDLGGKIDGLDKMKSKIKILCGQMLTPQS